MQRLTLKPQDVIKPFVGLFIMNVAILTAWTLTDSYHYVRVLVEGNVDEFDRCLESYGACQSSNVNTVFYFLAPLAVANLSMVLFAAYECFKARHLPVEFAEVKWLSISLGSFAESLALGCPILLVSVNDTTAYFLVGSTLIAICCMTLLFPIFIPKIANRRSKQPSRPIGSTASTAFRYGLGWGSSMVNSDSEAPRRSTPGVADSSSHVLGPGIMRIRRRI